MDDANNSFGILPSGIIELIQTGHQTLKSIDQFQSQLDKTTEDLHSKNQKALLLINVTKVTGHDPQVREEGLNV